ncbi:LamG domain-containing protein [Arthrobacter sp. Alg241-R88]|uniref:LamG domain-containing protein n=1 Tax=Arthrobacter sp. Alg241-R88 TaxID=2305984 RepID=UPI0013D68949|nr:LamG domain-containing protein [Arthrobacter sp. Alg241-R88]
MAHVILGEHADKLTVRLTLNDGADLVATLTDTTGTEIDWPDTPTLEFQSTRDRDADVQSFAATVDGSTATWALTDTDVDTIAADSPGPYGRPETSARITLPDDSDGKVLNAGKVDWRTDWEAGDRKQRVTFTLPGGSPGPTGPAGPQGPPGEGGNSSLTVVNGGTVDLDETEADGFLIGYKVTATTTIEGVSFPAGSYIFERDSTVGAGWTYRTVAAGTEIGDDPEPPADTLTSVITALEPGHYWPLEADLTPATGGVALTNIGSVTFTDEMAEFNGSTQRLEAAAPLPHNGATALSFVAKIRLTSDLAASANYGVFSNPYSTSMGIYDTYHWAFENIGVVNGGAIWTAGEHIIGWTWDGTNMRLYRDGVLDATRAKATPWPDVSAGDKFTIAGRAGSSTFTGAVAHMAAWKDVVLTDADMLAIAEVAGVA